MTPHPDLIALAAQWRSEAQQAWKDAARLKKDGLFQVAAFTRGQAHVFGFCAQQIEELYASEKVAEMLKASVAEGAAA